jgi:hypothetical protein
VTDNGRNQQHRNRQKNYTRHLTPGMVFLRDRLCLLLFVGLFFLGLLFAI